MSERADALRSAATATPRLAGPVRALVRAGARVLPERARRWIGALWRGQEYVPPSGRVRFGHLRRLTPISVRFGKDRGTAPIDRWYIERFLARRSDDIRGRVLEVQDPGYTRRFGGDAVTRSDVLHAVSGNPQASVVADLTCAPHIPGDTFDCVILTQVLLYIEDVRSAIRTVHRILRPGGVVLATVPGISQIAGYDMDRWGDYWRFTALSARRMFECAFPPAQVDVEAHGNVLAAVAFLHGLASDELRPEELAHDDPDYQLVITIRARKSSSAPHAGEAP